METLKKTCGLIIKTVVALVVMISCTPVQKRGDSALLPSQIATSNYIPGNNWLQVAFTNPADPHASQYEGGPDGLLAAAINSAHFSVDMAAYSLNLWSIRQALIHAHQHGVVVRLVMESTNMDNQEIQGILDAGIPIIGDNRQGLMHDKFVVIDHSEVWTGSMNYTRSGVYKDNNNLVRMRSNQVAEDYTNEFEEMFLKNRFGPKKTADTAIPKLNIDGTPVEIYFPPKDKVSNRIVQLLRGAQESIHFLAYSFTSKDIGNAILERAQAGVSVYGVMDDTQIKASRATEYDPFRQAGLKVALDGNVDGLMHHKVIIIDQRIVITGSYNFTASAENTNDENVVIIFSPDVAAKFMGEFRQVYGQGTIQ